MACEGVNAFAKRGARSWFKTRPVPWSGVCRARWPTLESPIAFCRWRKSPTRSFARPAPTGLRTREPRPECTDRWCDMGLDTAEFDYLCKFVREQSAIIIDAGKEYLVESRLTPLAYQEGMESAQKLLERLRREPANGLHRKVLDAMTNNETIFFRDAAPFQALRQAIIPEFLGKRAADRRLSFWSAAASSG